MSFSDKWTGERPALVTAYTQTDSYIACLRTRTRTPQNKTTGACICQQDKTAGVTPNARSADIVQSAADISNQLKKSLGLDFGTDAAAPVPSSSSGIYR